LPADINGDKFCLTPRPECGAGGVLGGLGEGAKPDAPFLFTEASKTAARKATIYWRDMLFISPESLPAYAPGAAIFKNTSQVQRPT